MSKLNESITKVEINETLDNAVIFSVFNKNRGGKANTALHNATKATLDSQGIDYVELAGIYEGAGELSFMLPRNDKNVKVALNMALYSEQICILLSVDGNADLVFLNSDLRRMNIGNVKTYTKVPKGDHSCVLGKDYFFKFTKGGK